MRAQRRPDARRKAPEAAPEAPDWVFPLPDRMPEWMRSGTFAGYLAAPGFLPELLEELGLEGPAGPGHLVFGDLVFVAAHAQPSPNQPQFLADHAQFPMNRAQPAWAQNAWLDARVLPAPSIGLAAQALRAVQRNWWPHPVRLARRSALITEKLPRVSARPLVFGEAAPTAPLGSWTLWDETSLIAAPACTSPFPDGRPSFEEDRQGAPSRAYLKLWEAFTVLGARPGPGELCLDLGSSPGGWTWVLASLGARVFSVDKAPLDARIGAMPLVEHCLGSGFGLEPQLAATPEGPVDWLFSDMACYPERLLELVRRWLDAGTCRSFVCTLKFQGGTDHATARAFAAIPGSRLLHLAQNKHELTWALLR